MVVVGGGLPNKVSRNQAPLSSPEKQRVNTSYKIPQNNNSNYIRVVLVTIYSRVLYLKTNPQKRDECLDSYIIYSRIVADL